MGSLKKEDRLIIVCTNLAELYSISTKHSMYDKAELGHGRGYTSKDENVLTLKANYDISFQRSTSVQNLVRSPCLWSQMGAAWACS